MNLRRLITPPPDWNRLRQFGRSADVPDHTSCEPAGVLTAREAASTSRLDGFILSRGEGRTIPLPAAAITFKASGEPDTGDPFVAEMAAEPAFPGPGPHVHREHQELFYVLEGRFDFLVGERTLRAEAGTFVGVPRMVVHDFRNPGPGLARLLGIVTPGGVDQYFERFHEMYTEGTLDPESFGRLRADFATDELEIVWNSSPAGGAGTGLAEENAL